MAIKVGAAIHFFFWIKLVPIHKSKNGENHKDVQNKGQERNKANQKASHDVQQVCLHDQQFQHLDKNDYGGWEWDLCSARFLLLTLAMLAADTAYIFLTVSLFSQGNMALFNVTTLVFKFLNLTPAITFPWLLGHAARQMGQHAMPLHLALPKQDIIVPLLSVLCLYVGLMSIHSHNIGLHSWYAIPVAISSCLSGLGFLSILCTLFAWLHDFRQVAKVVGQQETITADESGSVLLWFEQLKAATGNILFVIILLSQVIQIFSSFNVLTGEFNIQWHALSSCPNPHA